ncbi:MAG: hypothetical protein IJU57_04980 [Clostridia bacterium]|nr:hypothetical protein [Clostridia bacterium]
MRALSLFLAFLIALFQRLGFISRPGDGTVEAVYLGVENYGREDTDKEHIKEFRYVFETDGEQLILTIADDCDSKGRDRDYPVQNVLECGRRYRIRHDGERLEYIREIPSVDSRPAEPPVSGIPGEKTVLNLLRTAMMPVGSTLYIYGGGWNWQDDGASEMATDIGLAPEWGRFFREQDRSYRFKDSEDRRHSYYPYGGYNQYYYAGLDCSGYIGWVLYNTLNSEPGGEGMVWSSTTIASRLSDMGYGAWDKTRPGEDGKKLLPGDIVSIKGHVWMCIGTCSDGSIVIAHSTPSPSRDGCEGGGVQLSAIGSDRSCGAMELAESYMKEYCPEWSERYEVQLKDPKGYTDFSHEKAGVFSWNTDAGEGLKDPEGIRDMDPGEVLSLIFSRGETDTDARGSGTAEAGGE